MKQSIGSGHESLLQEVIIPTGPFSSSSHTASATTSFSQDELWTWIGRNEKTLYVENDVKRSKA